jgi:hypothetical protein
VDSSSPVQHVEPAKVEHVHQHVGTIERCFVLSFSFSSFFL